MTTISHFEDVQAWKSARELVNTVYRLTQSSKFRPDCGLKDQLRRAAVSALSNSAEGFESQSDRHFVSYLFRARGSVGEVRCQLHVALDQNYIDRTEFEDAIQKAYQTSRLIAGFIVYLRANDGAKAVRL
ncbi:MAG: four helix bundle protein [Acidobacteria bacterium]|nr:four helix bundle protein [Acidobacteriota bacterium]